MRHLVTPTLFLSAAAALAAWNRSDPREQLAFPFLSPLAGSDPVALGRASVGLMVVLGLVSLLFAVIRQHREDEDEVE